MQSNNNNNNNEFMTGPFSATTTSPSHFSDHPFLSDNPTSSPHLPSTPTPANINPRDGIINYLIYQELLTPDLSLTIPAVDLNTILSTRAKPTSVNSELFSVPVDTSTNHSDRNSTRPAQLPTFSKPQVQHSNLPISTNDTRNNNNFLF